ncbi:cytosine permease [Candidatus Pelagibacter sp.]|uniref:cytosine permease n=1 Tax=Candidatus Pelagibacter sp. TaxID=2024849 RepID=UPI003F87ECBD
MAKSDKNELINWELVATNPSDKTWDWKDLFCYWGVNIQSIIGFSLIASLYLIYQLNTTVVFLGSVLGSLLVWFFCNLIGKPSQVHGVPFIVLLRASLGYKGAKYFGALRFLVGIFMFGIQTYFLSKAFSYLIRILFFSINDELLNKDIFLIFLSGLNIIDWFSILIAIILQTYFFRYGVIYSKKIIKLSALIVYSGLILFFFIVFLSDVKLTLNVFLESLNFKGFLSSQNIIPLFTVAGTVFAYFSIVILSFGDFSKYVQTEKELIKGNLSILINLVIFSFFAVFITIGSDIFLKDDANSIVKILTNPTDIIGKFNNIQLTVIALLFIILASASTNLVANFIPCQFTLINFLPKKLNLQSSSYVISVIGLLIGILWLPLFSQIGILAFVDTFGSFFGPLFGLMITDYYLVKNKELVSKDIYSIEKNSTYYYSNGWHLKAIYCLILGFIFAASTIWNYNLMYLQSFSWIIGAFITSLTYYLLAKK